MTNSDSMWNNLFIHEGFMNDLYKKGHITLEELEDQFVYIDQEDGYIPEYELDDNYDHRYDDDDNEIYF